MPPKTEATADELEILELRLRSSLTYYDERIKRTNALLLRKFLHNKMKYDRKAKLRRRLQQAEAEMNFARDMLAKVEVERSRTKKV